MDAMLRKVFVLTVTVFQITLLSSCGGGGGTSKDAQATTPASAPPVISAETPRYSFDTVDLSHWQIDPSKDKVLIAAPDGRTTQLALAPDSTTAYVIPVVHVAGSGELQLHRGDAVIRREAITLSRRSQAQPGAVALGLADSLIDIATKLKEAGRIKSDVEAVAAIDEQIAAFSALRDLIRVTQSQGAVLVGSTSDGQTSVSFDQNSLIVLDEIVAKMLGTTFAASSTTTSMLKAITTRLVSLLVANAYAQQSCASTLSPSARVACNNAQAAASAQQVKNYTDAATDVVKTVTAIGVIGAGLFTALRPESLLVEGSAGIAIALGIIVVATDVVILTTYALATTPGYTTKEAAIDVIKDLTSLALDAKKVLDSAFEAAAEHGWKFNNDGIQKGVEALTGKGVDKILDKGAEYANEISSEHEGSGGTPTPSNSGGASALSAGTADLSVTCQAAGKSLWSLAPVNTYDRWKVSVSGRTSGIVGTEVFAAPAGTPDPGSKTAMTCEGWTYVPQTPIPGQDGKSKVAHCVRGAGDPPETRWSTTAYASLPVGSDKTTNHRAPDNSNWSLGGLVNVFRESDGYTSQVHIACIDGTIVSNTNSSTQGNGQPADSRTPTSINVIAVPADGLGNMIGVGRLARIRADVRGASTRVGETPTGTVTMSIGGATCSSTLIGESVPFALCEVTPTQAGSAVPLTAQYSGDARNAPNSKSTTVQVGGK